MRMRTNKNSGFTLIEVMIVVGILGVLSVLAVPNLISMRQSATLSAEARQLYAGFLQAQGLAISTGKRAELVLNRSPSNQRWWSIMADNDGDGSNEQITLHRLQGSTINFGPFDGVVNVFPKPYQDVPHNSWCTVCGINSGSVQFGPDGEVTNADADNSLGAIFLYDPDDNTKDAHAVVFVGETGAVRMFRTKY